MQEEKDEFYDAIKRIKTDVDRDVLDEGYSSREIEGSDSKLNEGR